jgi:hypothetical protein
MLALALEALDRTGADINVNIFCDTDTCVDETEYVRDLYYPEAMIFHAKPHVNVPSGMWNILNALKYGYETGARYVFIVEEDICIFPDYFDWHMAAQTSGDYIATCGRKMLRYPNYTAYTNPGSCFSHDKLGLIARHITSELFQDHVGYMDKTFGVMDESSHLDDGLIRRVARQHGLQVKYPETPKCAHIGFRMYNNLDIYQNQGDIETRIAGLRKMLPTISPSDRYAGDFEPIEAIAGLIQS